MSIRFIGAVWDSGLFDGPRLLMMLALADHADDDGWCYPNYDTLALKIRRNRKSVYRILSDLEGEGAVRRQDSRIGICDPHILDEVRRRAQSRHQRPVEPPAEPPAEPATEPPQPPDPNLNIENPSLNGSNGADAPILKNEKENLKNENPILTPEKEILKNETPFYIDPSINHQSNRQEPPSPAAEQPAPPAGGGGDVPAILRWANFTDRLNPQEQATLDPPTALAWAYFIHLEEAKPTRPKNAIGLARSRWRANTPPPDDLLALARCWLALPDDGRRALLDRVAFAARFGSDDDLDDDFPGLPIAAAIALYRATAGELAPPSLTPIRESTAAAIAEARDAAAAPNSSLATRHSSLWNDALAELELQMTRGAFKEHLSGSTATIIDDDLTVHVANPHAVDWLTHRLHPIIQRTADAIAGRPLTIHYEARP